MLYTYKIKPDISSETIDRIKQYVLSAEKKIPTKHLKFRIYEVKKKSYKKLRQIKTFLDKQS